MATPAPNVPTADWSAYEVGDRDTERLCAVCTESGPNALHVKLTAEEYAELPAPGSPGLCTRCGSREAVDQSPPTVSTSVSDVDAAQSPYERENIAPPRGQLPDPVPRTVTVVIES